MRKKHVKLQLKRETLLLLKRGEVTGGYSEWVTLCDPSIGAGYTACATRCIECPEAGPSERC
jgi:hypothetical protein